MDPLKHRVYTCPEGCCGVFIPHYVDIRKIEREHAEDVKKEKRIRKHKKNRCGRKKLHSQNEP